MTRTCTCAKGWHGAACDLCETGTGCAATGKIITILPQTTDKEDINTVVTVFGSELPKYNQNCNETKIKFQNSKRALQLYFWNAYNKGREAVFVHN